MTAILMIALLVVGFALLVKGADVFVDGASSIAASLKVPSLIIGLTVVALGTSLPEAAVSITAAFSGSNDIALGNVIGSNLFNLLVVVGLSGLICPMAVQKSLLRRDIPYSALIAVVMLGGILLPTFGTLSHADGLILLALFAIFMYYTISSALKSRQLDTTVPEESAAEPISLPRAFIMVVIGIVLIVIGAKLAVYSATGIARMFGISENIIGLTLVAFGTSLPELATSVVAARKGESDLSLGNAIGSNIFNITFVLGASCALSPIATPVTAVADAAILIAVTALFAVSVWKKRTVTRLHGATMFAVYLAYTAYICLR
ncbi:MAG: calcium/sodium antiporter [Butyricicoccaceae bacterium]